MRQCLPMYIHFHQPRSFHRTKSQTILPPTVSFLGHLYIYFSFQLATEMDKHMGANNYPM